MSTTAHSMQPSPAMSPSLLVSADPQLSSACFVSWRMLGGGGGGGWLFELSTKAVVEEAKTPLHILLSHRRRPLHFGNISFL